MRVRPIITCVSCGEDRGHSGRGLCRRCHHWHYKNKTLGNFAVSRRTAPRRPVRTCAKCKRTHRGQYDRCQDCRVLPLEMTPDAELTGGEWVRDGPTWRYVWHEEGAA